MDIRGGGFALPEFDIRHDSFEADKLVVVGGIQCFADSDSGYDNAQ